MTEPQTSPHDPGRSALDFVQRLLIEPAEKQSDLARLLSELAAVFTVSGAGLATFPEGTPFGIYPAPEPADLIEQALPWNKQPDLMDRLVKARGPLTVPRLAGGSFLVVVLGTPECGGWLLWLEDAGRERWSEPDGSYLMLVGHALTHRLMQTNCLPPWAAQLDRAIRKQRMDTAARLVRRLAHDFGNVLTGILGFSELGLAQQLAPESPLHTFLTEIHRGAQNGAQYTNQLRLFGRRQSTNNRSCNLADILAEEEKRLQPLTGANVRLQVSLDAELPAVAVEAEPLKQALAIVLDNAREAITGSGTIEISVRKVQLKADEARQLFGDLRPGTHLEIRVADNGSGLSAEVERQLFQEPFFTTKPRKRGFGLAMAYGILSAHRGGLELLRRPEGGTVARLVLPVVAVAATSDPKASASAPTRTNADPIGSEAPPRAKRVLVVDDDAMILQYVATTLERAGYRVQTVAHAEEALKSYRGSANDPFHLVLSDVLMPDVNGIDLVRCLLAYDPKVAVLFMSGQVPAEILNQTFGPDRFEVLSKPFRPEGLIRAVRAAIDRSPMQGRKSVCGKQP